MAADFALPEIGENIDSGTVARVLVAAGDSVSQGDALFEVETDKAVTEIAAPSDLTVMPSLACSRASHVFRRTGSSPS